MVRFVYRYSISFYAQVQKKSHWYKNTFLLFKKINFNTDIFINSVHLWLVNPFNSKTLLMTQTTYSRTSIDMPSAELSDLGSSPPNSGYGGEKWKCNPSIDAGSAPSPYQHAVQSVILPPKYDTRVCLSDILSDLDGKVTTQLLYLWALMAL